jgi:hypothetical protein
MITLTNCTVVFDGNDIDSLEGALINVSGESPNATVRIATPDKKARKFRTSDRLFNASMTGTGKKWKIEGTSEFLSREVGTDDSMVSLSVVAKGGCDGCR